MTDQDRFGSFAEFYPFYLREHSNAVCRALHYIGTTLGLATVVYALLSAQYLLLLAGIAVGYAFAWVGHFFFQHNKPATFRYPFYSFLGDWVMLRDFLSGKFRRSFPAP